MSFSFINIAMLAGLAAVVLPVVAHLLSKRRFEVVAWGAMQFLQLGQKTKRRIRLQDLLLLLLRMLLLACLAIALARPYGQGAIFNSFGQRVSRDIVFVIDGSGSTGWKGVGETPHAAAVQWVRTALEDLNSEDTVAVIDARSRNRRLIHPPTTSFPVVRKVLDQIPEPIGTSNLTESLLDAIRILAATNNVTREVILLTDGQAFPWNLDDEFGLQRIDDALQQPAVTPFISVVDLSGDKQDRENCSVGKIELSREMTVPGFPIRFRATLKQSGGVAQQKAVAFSVNGQPAPESTRLINLLPNGEALVEFEHVFSTTGYFRISLSLEPDRLTQDDQSDAIVVVEDGIPVLLVDGATHIDETQAETFFLKSAFAASGLESPWVRTQVIKPVDLNEQTLSQARVVFLCNTQSITAEQQLALIDFVLAGGGVVFAPGDKVDPQSWNGFRFNEHSTFLPAEIGTIQSKDGAAEVLVTIESLSLEVSWLQQFRKETGVDFWNSRFAKWWSLTLPANLDEPEPAAPDEVDPGESQTSLLVRMTNGAPFLFGKSLGDGTILQLAVPLDADWSTLPARHDFVPFLHEIVFRLAAQATQHNVEVGMSIRVPLAEDERPRDFEVAGPGIKQATSEPARDGHRSLAAFNETSIPGLYTFQKKQNAQAPPIPFIVTDDRAESDLTPLDDLGWKLLQGDDRLHRIAAMSDLTSQVQSENSRTELWWLLLLFVLTMLISEVALTRKMLRQGHAD